MAHFVRDPVSLRENTMDLSNGLVCMLSRRACFVNSSIQFNSLADFDFLALVYISARFSIIQIQSNVNATADSIKRMCVQTCVVIYIYIYIYIYYNRPNNNNNNM